MAGRAFRQDSLVSLRLGHYVIAERIGAGGMGEVYRACDEHLDRDVAIKVLPSKTFFDDSARRHFRREALALSKLNHPNIATIHDFDTQQGIDFLVMEYVPGVTLSERIANHALPLKEITRLGLQLIEGLAAAHEQGVIHRDLKPNNLRLTPDDGLEQKTRYAIGTLLEANDAMLRVCLQTRARGAPTNRSPPRKGNPLNEPFAPPQDSRGVPSSAECWNL